MKLEIKLANHIKAMSFQIMGTIFMLVTLCFLDFDYDFVIVFLSWWFILCVPALYLHFEYFFENRGQKIEIHSSSVQVTAASGITKIYSKSELERIIVYKSASLDKGGVQFTPIESYCYARIIAKNGEEIIITCLLTLKLKEAAMQLIGVRYERKKRFFCTLSWK